MILSYSLDRFVTAIQAGTKIHTLRADPTRRWKVGMKIQHWRGNPRNVRATPKPYHFADGECIGIQEVQIHRRGHNESPEVFLKSEKGEKGRWMTAEEVELLAKNDALSVDEFREWFVPNERPECWMRVIHFTEFRY